MPASSPRIRVLVAKVGLDGHDRGAKVVARCLRDAGMEVVYTGLHRTPEVVVAAAVARATMGEIVARLRSVFGTYTERPVF